MALSKIIFTKTAGGLGYPATGKDFYSAFVHYGAIPSGLTSNNQTVIYQPSDAETLGINTTSFPVARYHVDEFFRANSTGVLYLSFNTPEASYSFSAVTALQQFANGEIRQVGVYQNTTLFATSQVQTLNTIGATLESNFKPLSIIYTANFGTGSTSTYSDITGLASPFVSVDISQDMGGRGYSIFTGMTSASTTGACVSNIGALLGTVSSASVGESIAWIGKFNVSNGVEDDTIGFVDGSYYRSYSDSALAALDAKGYIFLEKKVGFNGSFWTSDATATSATSDYSNIRNNRTIDKAERAVRTALLPTLNSTIKLNSDGSLTNDVIQYFSNLAKGALENMLSNNEISAMAVIINPAQNVGSTSTLNLTIQIVPLGLARTINVNIGLAVHI